jgi:hypothetical protein
MHNSGSFKSLPRIWGQCQNNLVDNRPQSAPFMLFLPLLKFMITHLSTPDFGERSVLESVLLVFGFNLEIVRRRLFRTRGRRNAIC